MWGHPTKRFVLIPKCLTSICSPQLISDGRGGLVVNWLSEKEVGGAVRANGGQEGVCREGGPFFVPRPKFPPS